MAGDGSCLKRSCTSGGVTRTVGPTETANLGDRSLDSRCAAGGAMVTVCALKNRATSSLSSRFAPVKLISTKEPSFIVTRMISGRRFRLLLGSCSLPRSSRSREAAIVAEASQQRANSSQILAFTHDVSSKVFEPNTSLGISGVTDAPSEKEAAATNTSSRLDQRAMTLDHLAILKMQTANTSKIIV